MAAHQFWAKHISQKDKGQLRQRMLALFLFFLSLVTMNLIPAISGYAYAQSSKTKEMSEEAVAEKRKDNWKPIVRDDPFEISNRANETKPGLPVQGKQVAIPEATRTPSKPSDFRKGEENIQARTGNSRTFRGANGGEVTESSPVIQNFKDSTGSLKPIEREAVEDAAYQERNKVPESFWDRLLPGSPQPVGYKNEAGSIKAYFETLGKGGVRVVHDNSQFTMSPSGARNLKPRQVKLERQQSHIAYEDVWPNVDLVYEYQGVSLKENIVINAPTQANTFVFDLKGAKAVSHPTNKDMLALDGPFAEKLVVGPLTVDVNGRGAISNPPIKQYPANGGKQIVVELDRAWLAKQPASAFPIVIDPPIHDVSYVPGGYYGQFTCHKSDGVSLGSNACNVNTGGLEDYGPKHWRTTIRVPYDQLHARQLLAADLYLPMRAPGSVGTIGTYEGRYVYVSWASCSNGFNCIGNGPRHAALIGADGTIDVTELMQWMKMNVGYGGWLVIWGEEWNTRSYKTFNAAGIQLHTYTNEIPSPVYPELPSSNPNTEAVVVSTEPQLKVTKSTDYNGDQVDYQFTLKTTTGSTVWSSGWTPSRQAIIPEGVLQDGGRYKWEYQYGDAWWGSGAQYGGSFRVDLRTGKDATQTYEELGPVSVSLNTGNVYTNAKTHAMAALGGDIGLTLDYNSPFLSRKGLEAKYYTNPTLSEPARYSRVEPNINYDWDKGSPAPGRIGVDNFSVKWSGYFVAPETGSYYFGVSNDDNMTVTVNGNTVLNVGCCNDPVWSTVAVPMTKGAYVPIVVTHKDVGGVSRAILKVKGAVSAQDVPTEWLRTKPLPTDSVGGLTGHYYYDDGSHNPSNAAKFLVRDDPAVAFDWGTAAPVPGAPADNFYVRWEGYFTAPEPGVYKFGVGGDDGMKVTVDGTERASLWSTHTYQEKYDATGIFLAGGQTVPIQVDYYDGTGAALAKLLLRMPNNSDGVIDPQYLTRGGRVLPAGWNISADADGNLAYERLKLRQNGDALVYDSDGASWLFASTGSGYTTPTEVDAILVKNADGTHTLTDADGRVYVFRVDGTLELTSAPQDDKHPTALRYEYTTKNGVPALKKIIDPVNPARYGTLYYQGDAGCRTPYAGTHPVPPGMLCGFETTDGQYTQFMYYQGHLSVVSLPGNVDTDLSYTSNGSLLGIRDALAAQAVYAGQFPDNDGSFAWIRYDDLGRATGLESPKPTPTGTRLEQRLEFLPNMTRQHAVGHPNPAGYTRQIEFDNQLRTTKACDNHGKCTTSEYDPAKDMVLSVTDPLGLKTTTIYDDEDRAIQSYGPAPAAWFGANRQPLAAYQHAVPKTETAFDEGIIGPAATYFNYEGSNNPKGKLFGGPKLHATGIATTSSGTLNRTWSTNPIDIETGREGWGVSLTGKLRLPAAGTYQIKAAHDDGVKIWIDDRLIADDWTNGSFREVTGSFTHVTGRVHNLRVEYYNVAGSGANDATLQLYLKQDGGFDWTTDWSSYLKPGYGLATTTTAYDAQIGNAQSKTNFSDPAYGIVQNVTIDPAGLQYQAAGTYELPGQGYMRQLDRTTPGGTVIQYTHWGALDTADNPCTPATESFKQAGFPKGRTGPDPDGSGPATALQSEMVYDDSGRVIAERTGNDSWTCTTYDSRGRVDTITIPTVGDRTGRVVTHDYHYGGNPLVSRVGDNNGHTLTTVDLLGRIVQFQDASGNITDTTYNALGQTTQRVSKLGAEAYTYDAYGRMTDYILDGATLAHATYDTHGRITQVEYPSVKDPATNQTLKLNNPTRDDLQRVTGLSYTLPNMQQISNSVTLSQSGMVLDEAVNGVDLSPGEQGFTYDKAGRLTQAKVAGHTYDYGFGTPNAACSAKTGNHANAGKNSNRMSYAVDGVATWYCYDPADRLIASSDAKYDAPTYDSHGNTLSLGTGAIATTFAYDQSDRNTRIQQGSLQVDYKRDHDNRILQRTVTSGGITTDYHYGYTGGSNYTFMYTNPTTKQVVEKYLTLPGGVTLTLRPTEAAAADKAKVSLRNLHGDTIAVLNGNGANETGILLYEPFGTQITPTSSFASANTGIGFVAATPPANMQGDQSATWAGAHRRSNETLFAIAPMQMGARVYVPGLGRFLQVDPVEGGTMNDYVYAMDPVNSSDYDGQWLFLIPVIAVVVATVRAVAVNAPKVVPIITKIAAPIVKVAAPVIKAGTNAIKSLVKSKPAPVKTATKAAAKPAQAPQYKGYQRPQADFSQFKYSGNALKPYWKRPYQYAGSRTLIDVISRTTPNMESRRQGLLSWKVPGTMNGKEGYYELVLDFKSKDIVHFLFTRN